jgi:putative endonuclease
MKSSRQALGAWGENLAAEYLTERGYTILERNLRTPYGEIDLVASQPCATGNVGLSGDLADSSVIVFIEVKTRSSAGYGLPEDSVTARKRAHLLAAIQAYMQEHTELECDWRVDVVAVERMAPGTPPRITHFENAFS